MKRSQAIPYVAYVVDDSLNGRSFGDDAHAVVRTNGPDDSRHSSRLVGWQCGSEPLFVAVHSYLDCEIGDDEAIELAADYLAEIGWFSGEPTDPDYVL